MILLRSAYAWFNLARQHWGNDEGANFRDSMAKEMTPEQIAEAQKLSKELLKNIEANQKAKE